VPHPVADNPTYDTANLILQRMLLADLAFKRRNSTLRSHQLVQ
jgi:hypothetical protein